jgi:hypothetical protein
MNARIISAGLAVFVAGCSDRPARPDPSAAESIESSSDSIRDAAESFFEITDDPRIVFDQSTPLERLTLRGIGLGDDESNIPVRKIRDRQPNGWIVAQDLCRYRIVGGKVVTLGLWDGRILARLEVEKEEDVARIFGEPEKKLELTHNVITFHYRDGLVRLVWHRFENRLVALNVGRPAMEPEEEEERE